MRDRLEASGGLTLRLDAPHWRIAWGAGDDWFGPVERGRNDRSPLAPDLGEAFEGEDDIGAYRGVFLPPHPDAPAIRSSARAYDGAPLIAFRLEASRALHRLASGRFEDPPLAWPLLRPAARRPGGLPEGTRSYGHQYTEFALPVSGDDLATGFVFAPHRPPVVVPLMLVAPDGHTLMLAPLDRFHEQIVAVPPDREHADHGIHCGWHGDLDEVPEGFATDLAVWAAPSPRRALEEWAALLRRRHHTRRPSRYCDELLGALSYWTDNGAVYYYRTEPGCDATETLARAVNGLRADAVPVRSLQIDSWFYPHRHPRPVSAEGAPIVPPSGMMTWEPRADVFPDGFDELRRSIGDRPLTFHSRHFSSESPYFERYAAWRDGEYAHPIDSTLFDRLMEQAASWGAITYEQDWMVESFLGVRGLRQVPGRARAWQEALDRSAGARGLHLQWCMATPADFMQTVALRNVASIRTSGDYRYLFDNGLNWTWFLHTNALARALGLNPFKDVFLSHGPTPISEGEPYAEVESLLAALSTGPVGIGDQLGHTNREIVMRTCREDGVLIKPDVPIAALDRCFGHNAFLEPAPLIGECHSRHPAGRWIYVAAFNVCRAKRPLKFRVALADLGPSQPDGPVLAYDWRARTWTRLESDGGWEVTLEFQDWDYRVLCPLLPGEITVFGDVAKYATTADRRIARIEAIDAGVSFDVAGAAGTLVEVRGYSAAALRSVTVWCPDASREVAAADAPTAEGWKWSADTGEWTVRVRLDRAGYTNVGLRR